jgi:circadian clock protein KaiB
MPPNSVRAIKNAGKICEEQLQGRYQLEIIDFCQRPFGAGQRPIFAAPTLG